MDLTKLFTNNTSYISLKGIKGQQFGKAVVTIQCKAIDVIKFLEIDREVQRELDEIKVSSIGQYIQYGLDGHDIYFSPLIFSARNKGYFDEQTNEFNIPIGETMPILDGQHRIKAFEYVINRMESMGYIGENYYDVKNFPLTVQIYLDLTTKQEKQLFTDINTKSSLVNSSIIVMYNNNDLYARMVQEITDELPVDFIETRSKYTSTKLMTASTFYKTARILNEGLLSNSQKSNITKDNFLVYKERTEEFLTLLRKYSPIDALNRDKYVVMSPNIIMAIAFFVYKTLLNSQTVSMEDCLKTVLTKVDWSHKNGKFRNLKSAVFNKKTKKFNFNSSIRTINEMSEFLKNKYM